MRLLKQIDLVKCSAIALVVTTIFALAYLVGCEAVVPPALHTYEWWEAKLITHPHPATNPAPIIDPYRSEK